MYSFKPFMSILVVMSLSACTGQFSVTPDMTGNNGSNTNGTSNNNGTNTNNGTSGSNTGSSTGNGNSSGTGTTTPIDNTPIASGGTGLLSSVYKTSVKPESFPLKVEKDGTTLSLSKYMFKPGEQVSLTYTVPTSYSDYAWIGIIPSKIIHGSEKTNDDSDVGFKYIEKTRSGVLNFTMPTKSGLYDFRLNDQDDETGKEVSSLSFIVSNADQITDGTLKIQKNVFKVGEPINLDYTAPLETLNDDPWVGVVPSNIPHGTSDLNDQHDVSYKYIEGMATGTFVFTTEFAPGNYDFRLHDKDANGKELTYVSFTVIQ